MIKKTVIPVLFFLVLALGAPSPIFAASKTVVIHSEASIKDILELTISKAGQSELRFGSIQSSTSPANVGPLTVVINVTSNTGTRYQVTQLINGSLQNPNGDKIGPENLKFKTSSQKTAGTVISSPTALSVQPQTIFVSDENGGSDTISAEYILTVPPLQEAGDYSALLTYTASAL